MDTEHKYNVLGQIEKSSLTETLKPGRPGDRVIRKKAVLLDRTESDAFAPMHWPMLDDGKKPGTNALGYATGNWYAEQRKKIEDEERARLEAIEKERAEKEALEKERERQRELTVAELEKIRQQAREEGFAEGQKEGEAQGYNAGFAKGQEEGYAQGLSKGHDEGLRQGLVEGREEGFAKGQEEGVQSGTEMVQEQVERFRMLADMLSNPLRQVDRDVTDEIIYIISRLSSVILKREIKQDAKFLANAIDKAMELLPNASHGATITLNPDDLSLIEALIPKEYREQNNWSLQSNEALNSGDVTVSNDISKIEWRVDDRVDNLLNEFLINASGVVSSALRESLDNCPDYDALPKHPLAPNPNLSELKDKIVKGIDSAPYTVNQENQPSEPIESQTAEAVSDDDGEGKSESLFDGIKHDPFKEE